MEAGMRHKATISVRGREHEWSVTWDAPQGQIDAMRDDGIDVGLVMHTVPEWAVSVGLLRPWCFVQDVWNFRNPFRG
jgi:hypothetical protein